MKPLVYLAGPISADPLDGTRRAIDTATVLLEMAVVPFVPHLTCFWHLMAPQPYETWMAYDLEVLRRCDALYRIPGVSPGADREVTHARSLDLPVFFQLGDLLGWASAWRVERAS